LNRLDLISIRNILSIRYNPKENSLILPATWKNFNNKTTDIKGKKTEKLLINYAQELFQNKTGPLVVSLSSGIDSSLCLAIIRKAFPNKEVISICGIFEKSNDESKLARKIAKQFDTKFKTVQMPSIFTTMPEIISVTKKPKWNTYTHVIAKEASKYGTDFITGDGADEIFGGYVFRYSKFLNLFQSNDNWKVRIINYLECHNRDWVSDQEQIFGSRIKFDWNTIYIYFKTYFKNSLDPLQQVMLADFNGKLLHDFIPTAKEIASNYNLNSNSLFLKSKIINFGLSLPSKQKYDYKLNKGKLILRDIAKRYKIDHIEHKKGFSPSLWFDWQNNGKKIFEKFVLEKDSNIFKNKLINYNWVLRAFERIENDGDIRYLNRLISLLALEIWYRIFVNKDLDKNTKLF
jgi:asparagine synthase (glutamine-hydrolysing)